MTAIADLDWEQAIAALPTFSVLPLDLRQAFALLEPSRPSRLPAPQAEALLESGFIHPIGSGFLPAGRFAHLAELVAIASATGTLLDGSRAGNNRYIGKFLDTWGDFGRHFAARLQTMTDRSWSNEQILQHTAQFTNLALTAELWDWGGVHGTGSHKDLIHLAQVRRMGQKLLRWIDSLPEPPTLTTVLAHLPDPTAANLILRWTTQNLALFLGFARDRGELTLGLHPAIYAQRSRPAVAKPVDLTGVEMNPTSYLVEDVTILVAAAATEPIKVCQDGTVMVREHKRLEARLGSFPAMLEPFGFAEHRISDALRMARSLGLIGETRRFDGLNATEQGRDWLGQTPGRRHHRLLELLRPAWIPDNDPALKRDGRSARYALINALSGGRIPLSNYPRSGEEIVPAIAAALRELGTATWNLSQAFTWWSRRSPLSLDEIGPAAERQWQKVLTDLIIQRGVPLGLVALGGTGEKTAIALTDAGRWMVGLADAWTPPETLGVVQPIIVQADFTVIFLAPAPGLEAEIGRFAERCLGAVGTGGLFRLSKKATQQAAAAGLDAQQVLAVLAQASAKPLPANVVRELTGWFAAIRRITIRVRMLVEAPDEATALRICAAAGSEARQVGPSLVVLPKTTRQGELLRKLSKLGILLKQEDP